MWQQTEPLVSSLETQAPGSGLQRSSGRVRGETDPETEPDWVQGIMRSIGGTIKGGIQNITRHPSEVLNPSNLLPTSVYQQGRGTLSPRNLPRLCSADLATREQSDPVRVPIQSSPSVDILQMPSEVQKFVSRWRAEAAGLGELTADGGFLPDW